MSKISRPHLPCRRLAGSAAASLVARFLMARMLCTLTVIQASSAFSSLKLPQKTDPCSWRYNRVFNCSNQLLFRAVMQQPRLLPLRLPGTSLRFNLSSAPVQFPQGSAEQGSPGLGWTGSRPTGFSSSPRVLAALLATDPAASSSSV